MNKYIYIIVTLITTFLVLSSAPAFADSKSGYGSGCQPTYGGGRNCDNVNVTINKTVKNPKTGDMVDNLTVNDPKYGPDALVTFQITITNVGNTDIDKATVTDNFPQYVRFHSGAGVYDANTKTLTFELTNLKKGESRSFTVNAQTAAVQDLPSNQAVTCITNKAHVFFAGMQRDDNADFCIEKQVVTTKGGMTVYPAPKLTTTPSTGPEMLALFGLIPAALGGFALRRKSIKK